MKYYKLKVLSEVTDEFDNLIGADFTMALTENLDKIESKIKNIDSIIKPSKEYKVLTDKRDELFKKYADRDDDDQLVLDNNLMKITDKANLKLYKVELQTYLDKAKKCIDEHDLKIKEYTKAMNKDCSLKFTKITRKDVPKNISQKQMQLLKFMIIFK